MTTFGSVCSGIEAASVAWHPLGWRAAWLSEIEPFPCAVLAHHYPDVPNLGDMTALPEMIRAGLAAAPDVFTGGTPCQAFSVAGKRESLGDARGNLSLTFCEIANAIDDVRRADGREPSVIVWENVPGVLSTADNAFGCFLGALAGADCELQPTGKRWADAGVVLGPRRTVAWRIIDAQYFGLAQRRKRVFVVASARNGFDPAAVLLEFDSVRRDSAPSREAREGTAASTARSVALRGREGGGTAELGDELQNCLRASGGGGDKPHVLIHADPIARCVTTGEAKRQDWETCNFVAHCRDVAQTITSNYGKQLDNSDTALGPNVVAHPLRGEGFDASEDGTGWGTPLVPVATGFIPKAPPNSRSMGEAVEQAPTVTTHQLGQGVQQGMAVRRLTPTECERLMGFPDSYTAIPWRKKPADQCPDGPRYKALGNSWAVPCARWIGERIDAQLRAAHSLEAAA